MFSLDVGSDYSKRTNITAGVWDFGVVTVHFCGIKSAAAALGSSEVCTAAEGDNVVRHVKG